MGSDPDVAPSSDLAQLADRLLQVGGVAGGVAVATLWVQPSLGALLAAGGATLFVSVVVPPCRALGRNLERLVDRRMGMPSRGGDTEQA